MRVLVCDDSRDAADTLAILLRSHGHDVQTSYGARACLEAALSEWRPQIVFLDIGMPEVSGYEVARTLRAALGSQIRLVAVTAWGSWQDKELAEQAGFDLHMTKPVDFQRISGLLQAENLHARKPDSCS